MNEKDGDLKKKVIPIQGDITHKGLGISDEDRQTLIDNVDIIMHSAATVKFNEPIKYTCNFCLSKHLQRRIQVCSKICR